MAWGWSYSANPALWTITFDGASPHHVCARRGARRSLLMSAVIRRARPAVRRVQPTTFCNSPTYSPWTAIFAPAARRQRQAMLCQAAPLPRHERHASFSGDIPPSFPAYVGSYAANCVRKRTFQM